MPLDPARDPVISVEDWQRAHVMLLREGLGDVADVVRQLRERLTAAEAARDRERLSIAAFATWLEAQPEEDLIEAMGRHIDNARVSVKRQAGADLAAAQADRDRFNHHWLLTVDAVAAREQALAAVTAERDRLTQDYDKLLTESLERHLQAEATLAAIRAWAERECRSDLLDLLASLPAKTVRE